MRKGSQVTRQSTNWRHGKISFQKPVWTWQADVLGSYAPQEAARHVDWTGFQSHLKSPVILSGVFFKLPAKLRLGSRAPKQIGISLTLEESVVFFFFPNGLKNQNIYLFYYEPFILSPCTNYALSSLRFLLQTLFKHLRAWSPGSVVNSTSQGAGISVV